MLLAEDDYQKTPQTTNWKTDGFETAQSIDDVKKGLPFAKEWKTLEWKGNSLLVGLSEFPTDGESCIDVHCYIYNRHYKEWRRFCVVKTRNVYGAEVRLDAEEEELYLIAMANTPMKGKRVFRYSLLLLSDDRAYLSKDAVQAAPSNR